MRYEFREGASAKFWEARVEGNRLTTSWGRIGAAGQTKTKAFRDAAAAKKAHDALVAEKTRKGYRPVGAQPAPAPASKPVVAHNEKLEAAILADRTREQPWLVYADYLQDQGDPRGELASLQARQDPKLARAAEKLLWARREHFFGPLAPMVAPFTKDNERSRAVTATWRHGWMDTLRLSAASGSSSIRQLKKGKRPSVVLFTLGHPQLATVFKAQKIPARFAQMPAYFYESKHDRQSTLFKRLPEEKIPKPLAKSAHKVLDEIDSTALSALPLKVGESAQTGFHYSASFGDVEAAFEADGFEVVHLDEVSQRVPDVSQVAELVPLLPRVASARLLRELVLGSAGSDGAKFDFGTAIKALARVTPSLQTLERLFIGDFTHEDSELSWSSLGSAAPLWKAFPRLRALTLRAGKMTLGTIDHAALEELVVITGGLSRDSLRSITRARLPRLHTLSVWFGAENYGCTCRLEDIEELLESPVLANVKHLGLKNCELGDEVVALLAKSKVLARLESLDVSMSHLTQAAVDTITANAKAFSRLARLDVHDAVLPKGVERALRAVVKGLEFGKQDPSWWGLAEGVRYTAIGE